MTDKEAKARIKINKLLEKAGWRLLDDENGREEFNKYVSTRELKQGFFK